MLREGSKRAFMISRHYARLPPLEKAETAPWGGKAPDGAPETKRAGPVKDRPAGKEMAGLRLLGGSDQRGEGFRLQGSAAHQGAVNVRL